MKKIVSTTDLGGAPVFKNDLREVFNVEFWDVIEALLSPYDSDTEGLIISGCEISAGSDYDITAGIVYLNGEFMRLPASTGNAFTTYIAPATPSEDTRTFADGSTNGLVETKAAEIVGSAPGAGQYITISSLTNSNSRRWTNLNSGAVYITSSGTQSSVAVRRRVYEIGEWDMDTDVSRNVTLSGIDVSSSLIISVTGVIRPDSDSGTPNRRHMIGQQSNTASDIFLRFGQVGNTGVVDINRETGGTFDSTSYDQTAFNRGWILVDYIE